METTGAVTGYGFEWMHNNHQAAPEGSIRQRPANAGQRFSYCRADLEETHQVETADGQDINRRLGDVVIWLFRGKRT